MIRSHSASDFGLRYRGCPGTSQHQQAAQFSETASFASDERQPFFGNSRGCANVDIQLCPKVSLFPVGDSSPSKPSAPSLPSTQSSCTIKVSIGIPGSSSHTEATDNTTTTADYTTTTTTTKCNFLPFTSLASATEEYAARLHPTLLQHYYDVMNSIGSGVAPPALAFCEIVLGDIIGKGGFSFVSEINGIKLQEIYDTGNEEAKSRANFAASFSSNPQSSDDTIVTSTSATTSTDTPPSLKYVLKTLRPDLPEDEHNKGIIDLAVEAQFLATLSHPHILSLRGTANSDPLESRYFVILDRLVSTLDQKLKVWRKDVGNNMGYWMGPCLGYCCGRDYVLQRIWVERFEVGRDIASALEYLHGQDIVYRDLKPDNIGFNSEGELKMFDFGLAKRVTNADRAKDNLYHLTGNTGSLRYMAPEVSLNQPYNLSVDSYSFGILFWQLLALTTPFSGYSCKMHADLVVGKGYRPKPDGTWPESWSLLMRQCWATDYRNRPSFEHVLKVMNAELEELNIDSDLFTPEESKATEKIKAMRRKSIKSIKARKDGQRLDVDTRLVTKPDGPTKRRHDTNIV